MQHKKVARAHTRIALLVTIHVPLFPWYGSFNSFVVTPSFRFAIVILRTFLRILTPLQRRGFVLLQVDRVTKLAVQKLLERRLLTQNVLLFALQCVHLHVKPAPSI